MESVIVDKNLNPHSLCYVEMRFKAFLYYTQVPSVAYVLSIQFFNLCSSMGNLPSRLKSFL